MSVILNRMKDIVKAKTETTTKAIRWVVNSFDTPKNKPSSVTAAFIAFEANIPVISIPTIPPTPWQGNTSSVSSKVDLERQWATKFETSAATVPTNIAFGIVTNPAAGVMATNPTTAPIQKPIADTFLPFATSNKTQARPAAAAAVFVVANAIAA